MPAGLTHIVSMVWPTKREGNRLRAAHLGVRGPGEHAPRPPQPAEHEYEDRAGNEDYSRQDGHGDEPDCYHECDRPRCRRRIICLAEEAEYGEHRPEEADDKEGKRQERHGHSLGPVGAGLRSHERPFLSFAIAR